MQNPMDGNRWGDDEEYYNDRLGAQPPVSPSLYSTPNSKPVSISSRSSRSSIYMLNLAFLISCHVHMVPDYSHVCVIRYNGR